LETASSTAEPNAEDRPYPVEYTSEMLRLYSEIINQRNDPQILDIGPVCEENINHFARRIRRHFVCDMFMRLNRTRRKQMSFDALWNTLDYPYQYFNGIHLWDLIDHLDDKETYKLIERCHFMLKSRGLIMAVTFEQRSSPSSICAFVIRENQRVSFRPQPHLDFPRRFRSNRELTALLARFRLVRSFLYRNGVREFLFQRG
jgi:hypothetical protein